MRLRAMRRDRAARLGPELFLYERVFADCLERIELMQRSFRRALLIGCPDARWADRLGLVAAMWMRSTRDHCSPPTSTAPAAVEDGWEPPAGRYDLVLAAATLDTVNDLPRALLAIRFGLARRRPAYRRVLRRRHAAAVAPGNARRGRGDRKRRPARPSAESSRARSPACSPRPDSKGQWSTSTGFPSPTRRSTGWSRTCAGWPRPIF